MNSKITAIRLQIEETTTNDEGKIVSRPELPSVGIMEADIPDAVMDWLKYILVNVKRR